MKRALTLALVCGVAASLAAAASGGQAIHDAIHDEGSHVVEGYCGVEGLDVNVAYVVDLQVTVVRHGDGYWYFLKDVKETNTIQNLATGTVVTIVKTGVEKDKQITDNGDGTLTIVVLTTGNVVLYGSNGKAIARNPGQLRFELLIDEMGTPDDPFDDEVIERGDNVKGSTGRTDDICDAAVAALS